jgi:acyl transferase domain-containing protein/3-hydroxymyristoyl/3-hydroxydecanoyl-(acyl carrier protein) dehydratase/1-acyl-sn-glycerol-3-phosphate acyltransferase
VTASFEPIAIVGRGCVLPGCLSPEDLWRAVQDGACQITPAPEGDWRIDMASVIGPPGEGPGSASGPDHAWTDRGGYVGVLDEALDLSGTALDAALIQRLDPVFRWSLHAAGQALRNIERGAGGRAGLVLGNLSYPTRSHVRLAEHYWLKRAGAGAEANGPEVDPLNRFMSGSPAMLVAQAFGFTGGSLALDAACASGLYAIKVACDRLQARQADLMLAGAVNAVDQLFLHTGFTALNALSRTGRSRPFHAEADGLIPAEGAAFVALKRVGDALAAGDRILGVIRGIGLSNDGRSGGFLSPAREGQMRAMGAALESAGLAPEAVQFVECHATGTLLGDATEIESLAGVYGGAPLALGSLKANLGHLITASGIAGLLKTIAAMEHGMIPATPGVRLLAPGLGETAFAVSDAACAWEPVDGQRTAAVSSFGFGGNNAHLIVQQFTGPVAVRTQKAIDGAMDDEIVVVGIGLRTHLDSDMASFTGRLLGHRPADADFDGDSLALEARKLAFPPVELARALGQQTILIDVARQALAGVAAADRLRTGVYVGMQTDSRICLHGVRSRWRERVGDAALVGVGDQLADRLDSAAVIGEMPNVTANRLSNQYDLQAPGFAVSREELSGDAALQLAVAALRRGEIDAALVGAVDLCREPLHEAVAPQVLGAERGEAADAAVMLVLKTRAAAGAAGDPIVAILSEAGAAPAELRNDDSSSPVNRALGHAHAASGLLHVALAIGMLRSRCRLDREGRSHPLLRGAEPLAIAVHNRSFLGESAGWCIAEGTAKPEPAVAPPQLERYAACDRETLLAALQANRPGGEGACRLAIVGSAAGVPAQRARAIQALRSSTRGSWALDGISFREVPLAGEMAFAFTGAASAYPGMGRSLLLAMPELVDGLASRVADIESGAGAFYREGDPDAATPFRQLAGSSFLCQLHATLSLDILKLRPAASIGLSSGETNAMFAFGIWRDMDGLLGDVAASGLYSEALANRFDAVRVHWGLPPGTPVDWNNWHVRAPAAAVADAIAGEPRAYLTIVNGPGDCVIGGDAAACRAVLAALGDPPALPLGHDLAVHCAAVSPFEMEWRRAHSRETFAPILPVRFYSNAFGGVFQPTADAVTEALTRQALQTLDFPRIVELAWADGVRLFVEHGPRSSLSTAIGEILGTREHLALSFDRTGVAGDVQAWRTVASLWCAGVEIDVAALERATAVSAAVEPDGPLIRFELRKPAPELPKRDGVRRIPRPPVLAPIVSGSSLLSSPGRRKLHDLVQPLHLASLPGGGEELDFSHLLLAQARLTEAHCLYLDAHRSAMEAYLGTGQRLFAGFAQVRPMPLPTAPVQLGAPGLPGPKFDRRQLEILAGGRISSVFGESFAGQDGYPVQVRMPEPPLLLCDRVLGIEGDAHSMGVGRIWTQTDVRPDSWYLHHGRMPPGIFIECGQADLLLISWLGIDALNRGERAYRLLGCELTFHGDLPESGDALDYEIAVDGHARQGDVRLFFFHYDCRIDGAVRISVRNGQAGFFTPWELENSAGVIWDAATAAYRDGATVDRPANATTKRRFSSAEVHAWLDGDLVTCFGDAFALGDTHTRTPASPADHRNFLGAVTELDFTGGPAGRGYLRVETPVAGGEWFFDGHFKGDPCMPGTLMADACLQAMGFYMAAAGMTLPRDGWRFQPVCETSYRFLCRGQVTPQSRRITYEIFVDEFVAGERPTLVAHVLCTVDGRKAFLCERLGLQLVPDWPLTSMRERVDGESLDTRADDRPLAHIGSFPLDHASLMACALGRPSQAFGEGFAPLDAGARTQRLPGPPYHFMTRIVALEGGMGVMKAGAKVTALYDVPPDAWYFAENATPTMPNCVLMEVALQPCGWLAAYTLRRDRGARDLLFRNLDGDAVQHREIGPHDGAVTTTVELLSADKVGDLIIEKFAVRCTIGDEEVFRCETVFGFFPPEAIADQKGFGATDADRARLARPSDVRLELAERPAALFGPGAARLPGGPLTGGRLAMIDRISGYWPAGGAQGLGAIRAEKDVLSTDWFFKAHFYQDPVQPGSLGIEAILQAMQALLLLDGAAKGFASPRFEPITIGERSVWHYRGQVTPDRDRVTVEFEVAERVRDARSVAIIGMARLWVDGLQIYQVPRIGMRLVEGDGAAAGRRMPWSLDLDGDAGWLSDHCPTYTVSVVPLAVELDLMASAAASAARGKLVEIVRAEAKSWIALRKRRAQGVVVVEPGGDGAVNTVLEESDSKAATATLRFADVYPAIDLPPLAQLIEPRTIDDTYSAARVFHGPAFHLMTGLVRGANGATVTLDAQAGAVPLGLLHPALIDAALHGIPDDPEEWAGERGRGLAVYPLWIERMQLFADLREAKRVTAQLRFGGVEDGRFFRIHIRLSEGGVVLAAFDLVEIMLPKGRLGVRSGHDRRAFLKERRFVAGMALAEVGAHRTCLSRAEARRSNWLQGTQEQAYGALPDEDLVARIVVGDHCGQALGLHPGAVRIEDGLCANVPLNRWPIALSGEGDTVCTLSGDPAALDWRRLHAHWLARAGGRHSLVHDLGLALVQRFVRRVVLADPAGHAALRGRPVLYLANHQTGVESFLFMTIVAALSNLPVAAIAKREHADSWIGAIHRLSREAMGAAPPLRLLLFDRERPSDLLRLLNEFGRDLSADPASLLVHTDGTRARHAGAPVGSVSAVLIDLALAHDLPIVPVRFVGGLPIAQASDRFEFPIDLGQQDHFIGRAIAPGTLRSLAYADRAAFVRGEINALGRIGEADEPLAGDPEFAEAVRRWRGRGLGPLQAVLRASLAAWPGIGSESEAALAAAELTPSLRDLLGIPAWSNA